MDCVLLRVESPAGGNKAPGSSLCCPHPRLHDNPPRCISFILHSPPIRYIYLLLSMVISGSTPQRSNTEGSSGTSNTTLLQKSRDRTPLTMGLCVSCDDVSVDGAATARVVLPSGELREYSRPATAELALEEVGHGEKGWFLCDADAMGFEGSVSSLAGDDELRPGQIYFVLPADMLRRSLTLEEVAALAVKASAALIKAATASSAGGRRRRGSVAPLVFEPSEEDYSGKAGMTFVAAKPTVSRKRVVAAYRAGRWPPRFSPDLTAIVETE